eukprot:scaffold36637_cov30-Tisochrysis_lutea.AAC.1
MAAKDPQLHPYHHCYHHGSGGRSPSHRPRRPHTHPHARSFPPPAPDGPQLGPLHPPTHCGNHRNHNSHNNHRGRTAAGQPPTQTATSLTHPTNRTTRLTPAGRPPVHQLVRPTNTNAGTSQYNQPTASNGDPSPPQTLRASAQSR